MTDARIAITALAPTIKRVAGAEAALVGTGRRGAGDRRRRRGGGWGSSPISDVRGSADYRSAMAEVIARRAITGALTRARGGSVDIPASPALYGN